ncbi:MAG: hypothetical protein V4597_11535 [Pseudomonadota bacterium]
MPRQPTLSDAAASAAADAVARLLDGGVLWLNSQDVVLAELRFAAPCAPPAIDGLVVFFPLTAPCLISGRASWFVAMRGDNETHVFSGQAGTSDADLVLDSVELAVGMAVIISSFTYTQPKSWPA